MQWSNQNTDKLLEKVGRWGTVDTFLHFQPLLLYCKSKQAQNLSHNKTTLYTQYQAKTWKQRHSENNLQSICERCFFCRVCPIHPAASTIARAEVCLGCWRHRPFLNRTHLVFDEVIPMGRQFDCICIGEFPCWIFPEFLVIIMPCAWPNWSSNF